MTQMDELGRLLYNLTNVVPDGIVLFFPSYAYEEKVVDRWKESQLITKLEKRKKFIRESWGRKIGEENSLRTEDVLRQFQETIDQSYATGTWKGAILSCVIGGKLSEGINFSDGYGRCVVVVGMPYPNPYDPVLVEKMKFMSEKGMGVGRGDEMKQEYYENLCMRAVNQSIGRAIRHINDYAAILLVDQRYSHKRITDKLPKWIRENPVVMSPHFGQCFGPVSKFFTNKLNQQTTIEEQRKKDINL
jgi:chromosome transmission fidelity protein 1